MAVAIFSLALPFSCNKGGSAQEQTVPDTSDDPAVSKDPVPEDSADPSRDEDLPEPEMLAISPVSLSFTEGDKGRWYATATFTVDTDARDIYVHYVRQGSGQDLLSPDEVFARYKPYPCTLTDYGSKVVTIQEELKPFCEYDMVMLGANGNKYISRQTSFKTYNDDPFRTAYLEADEASASAGDGFFTLSFYTDKESFLAKEAGCFLSAKVSATGNKKNGAYIIPEGKYNVSEGDISFQAVIPGITFIDRTCPAEVQVKKVYTGDWQIDVLFDSAYDDWVTFKRVEHVVFKWEGPLDVEQQQPLQEDKYPLKSNIVFVPDPSTVTATLETNGLSGSYYKLTVGARSKALGDGTYDFLHIALCVDISDFPESIEGTYETIKAGTERFKCVVVNYLSSFLGPSLWGFTQWTRFKTDYVSTLDDLVCFAIPQEVTVNVSPSSDYSFIVLDIKMEDLFTDYSVSCKELILMTDSIEML